MDIPPMELFQKEAPEVAVAFNNLIMALVASKGLDQKTKQLIYIAMKAAMGDNMAVEAHVPMAKAAGATREGSDRCYSIDTDSLRDSWCCALSARSITSV